MKAIIQSVEKTNNANINVTFQIINDKDEVIFEGARGMTSLEKDPTKVLEEIKKNFNNIAITTIQEKESQLAPELQKLVGQEINLD